MDPVPLSPAGKSATRMVNYREILWIFVLCYCGYRLNGASATLDFVRLTLYSVPFFYLAAIITCDSRGKEYVLRLADHPNIPRMNLVRFLDSYITRALDRGPLDPSEFYDRISEKLLQADRDSITARGTRGSVLVEIGRIEEGKTMLQKVRTQTTATIDKTYANIFLALAEKRSGHLEAASEYAKAAAKFNPQCPALKRISDLLPVNQESSEAQTGKEKGK
jgi:hypothetical protein